MKFDIRKITKTELSTVMLEWAKKEGWKYSSEDVNAYFEINGNDIYALINSSGSEPELVGCISITKYHYNEGNVNQGKFLFSIGLFIVKEEYRGKKECGPILWKHAFQLLKQNNMACLNSVPRVTPFYTKNGFNETGMKNAHFELKLSDIKLFDQLSKVLAARTNNDNITHLQFTADDSPSVLLANYENALFRSAPLERNEFRNKWVRRSDAIVVAYVNNNIIEGYGVLTVCQKDGSENKSYRISPLYSDSVDVTAKLFGALLNMALQQNGKAVDLNVLVDASPMLSDILAKYCFTEVGNGGTELMTLSPKELSPQLTASLHRIIALSPLEFPHEACLLQNPQCYRGC